MQIVQNNAAFVRDNATLPDHLRESTVLLRFAEPIRSHRTGEFLRIHLTPGMMQDGEEQFYMAETFQPQRLAVKLCRACARSLDQIAESMAVCRNPHCDNEGMKVRSGPVRGVVDVMVFPDFVVQTTTEQVRVPDPSAKPPTLADVLSHRVKASQLRPTPMISQDRIIEWVNRCLLILDRRYNDKTLASVMRTAGAICDMNGWRLA